MARKVAVDVHRRFHYVLITEERQEVLRRRFTADAAGEAALLAALQSGDRVVLEATTGSFRLATRLESVGAEVTVLDPQELRAVGFRGKKTDYRDCQALLRYLDDPEAPVVWRPDPLTRELRQLTRERFAFNQGIVRLKNRVRALLADEGLPAPDAPWEPAGQAWLAEQVLRPTVRRILTRELAAIALQEELKAEQEQDLAALARSLPDVQRLLQLAGFGAALAVMWWGEVGDLRRFTHSKHLVSYAGLHPSVAQSGERVRHGALSKAGRTQLRWIMVEVAWRHVHQDGPEAAYFHRLVQRGKPEGVAIVALARRLLVLAYRLVTRRETHRQLDLPWFEAKLARLAATRPHGPEPEPCDRDWAADQVEALTGQTAPRRAAGLPRRLRRRPRASGSPEAGRTGGRRKHSLGSTPAGPAERGKPHESGPPELRLTAPHPREAETRGLDITYKCERPWSSSRVRIPTPRPRGNPNRVRATLHRRGSGLSVHEGDCYSRTRRAGAPHAASQRLRFAVRLRLAGHGGLAALRSAPFAMTLLGGGTTRVGGILRFAPG